MSILLFHRINSAKRYFFLLVITFSFLLDSKGAIAIESDTYFSHQVRAVVSKAGCNLGACHGNLNGKGGFKLSLRGEDPGLDYRSLTKEMFGRRVNQSEPEKSLLLLKPTASISHRGGQRFEVGSVEYEILKKWIQSGAKPLTSKEDKLLRIETTPKSIVLPHSQKQFQIKVTAYYSSGKKYDVTRLTVFEPSNTHVTVSRDGIVTRKKDGESTILARFLNQQRPIAVAMISRRTNYRWNNPPENNYIDKHVFTKLKTIQVNPSELASDRVFIRRLYLDVLGILPTVVEAKQFIADPNKNKRAKLINKVLNRNEYADHWALKWSDLLRNEEKSLDKKGVQVFHAWIRKSIADNKPLDQFVRELILAQGSTYKNPPANYYRALRDPIARAEASAQVFLGIRLRCAKCHNHPFDNWTQDNYYQWAANFSQIKYKILKNERRDKLDKHAFVGEQIVQFVNSGEVTNPKSGKAVTPKMLAFASNNRTKQTKDKNRLQNVATWLTSKNNRQFAMMQVNRIWFQVMHRGIVDPIDDMRSTNPPSNPALLDALTDDFIRSKFDLKKMLRTILNSRVYQLSSKTNATNHNDHLNFSYATITRLKAEQLLDAIDHSMGVQSNFVGYAKGLRAGQIPGVLSLFNRYHTPTASDRFLETFGKPKRLLLCECERSKSSSLVQILAMIGGEKITAALADKNSRLVNLIKTEKSNQKIIEQLYWITLTRPPSTTEAERSLKLFSNEKNRLHAVQDLSWALMNSKEFLFRH